MNRKTASVASGCPVRCTFDKLALSLYSNLSPRTPGQSQIALLNTQTEMVVEEEAYVYDGDNLIADVGGYLGLLLGASIMSFYDAFVHVLVVAKDKFFGSGKRK